MKIPRTVHKLALFAVLALVGLTMLAAFTPAAHIVTGHMASATADWFNSAGLAAAMPFAAAGKTKFFRVATEGATTDGRSIERSWIDQMAATFNREKYGARIWLEHYRGITADSIFPALGDVTALEARDVEEGKRALFAQIDPLPALVDMVNVKKQKIYTSIEVDPNFAKTGQAYLIGLAVTDSPASLGTEQLKFSAGNPQGNPLAARKQSLENLFTAAIETAIEFEADTTAGADVKGFTKSITDAVGSLFKRKAQDDDTRFAEVAAGIEAMAKAVTDHAEAQSQALNQLSADHKKLADDFAALEKKHTDLVTQLGTTTASGYTKRPPATGGNGVVATDC